MNRRRRRHRHHHHHHHHHVQICSMTRNNHSKIELKKLDENAFVFKKIYYCPSK
jgi:hypothetical protein